MADILPEQIAYQSECMRAASVVERILAPARVRYLAAEAAAAAQGKGVLIARADLAAWNAACAEAAAASRAIMGPAASTVDAALAAAGRPYPGMVVE